MNERLTRFNKLTNEYEYCLDNPNTSIIQDEIAGIQKLGEYENIDTDVKHLAKVKEAFEIIKTKKVDVCSFINYFVEHNNTYETYVLYFNEPIEIDYGTISEELLTEKEFNLLRKVLL